jgi:hypothetical protein
MAGRTIAVGDIHGCSAALASLLDAVRPGPADTVVALGDLIDRGPDSRGVLDQILALARLRRLVLPGFLVCIDTDCVRGGWLTALDTATGRTWQADRAGTLRARSDQ